MAEKEKIKPALGEKRVNQLLERAGAVRSLPESCVEQGEGTSVTRCKERGERVDSLDVCESRALMH